MIDLENLAREYAEEMIKGKPSEELPNCLKNSMLAMNTEYVAEIFRWLTRRYCLVEKSKIEEAYKACASMRDDNLLPNIESAILHHRGVEGVRVLKSLFPEIAKVVE